jgi:hypothetical protein
MACCRMQIYNRSGGFGTGMCGERAMKRKCTFGLSMVVMQTFRNNQISGMVWLVLVWLVGSAWRIYSVSVPAEFGHGVFFGASLAPLWAGVLWSLLLLANALLANAIFIRLNQFDQTSLLPGLLSILVGLMFPGLDTAFASLFLLFAFFFMLPPPGRSTGDLQVFNSGVLIGLAALTYFPLLSFIIVGPIILGITGKFSFRQSLIWLTAFILPWIYAAFFKTWLGQEPLFLLDFLKNLGLPKGVDEWLADLWLSLGFITLSGFLGLWKYSRFSGRLKVSQRRTFTIFTLIFLLFLLSGGVLQYPHPMHFQLMATPLGLFISFALFHEKRARVAWITLILWHVVALLSITMAFFTTS